MPKKPTVQRSKKPKDRYAKGWETRRAKASQKVLAGLNEALAMAADAPIPSSAIQNAAIRGQVHILNQAAQMSPETAGGDAILRTVMMHRDEQLCCFMGDMAALRRMGGSRFMPVVISRSQIEAIEDFLADQGFSMFGRSGASKAA